MTGSGDDERSPQTQAGAHDSGEVSPLDPSDVAPVDNDGVQTVLVGTVIWAVALVVLLVFRQELDEAGRGWWIWTAVAGVGFGLIGFEYARRRRDAIARVRQYRTEQPEADQNGRSASDS